MTNDNIHFTRRVSSHEVVSELIAMTPNGPDGGEMGEEPLPDGEQGDRDGGSGGAVLDSANAHIRARVSVYEYDVQNAPIDKMV